jgi:hypothetical protein
VNPLPGGGWFLPVLVWPAFIANGSIGPQPDSTTPANIALAVANAQGGYIGTFDEVEGQGYTVQQAIDGWHRIVTHPDVIAWRAGGGKLLSPLWIQDGSVGGSFFRQFLTGVAAAGDPDPDEYALDKYTGAGQTNATHVSQIMARVNNFHAAFPTKQLWMFEYAIDDAKGSINVPDLEMTDFMTAIRAQFDSLPWVTADLWFFGGPKGGVPQFGSILNSGLYNPDGSITICGSKWKTLGR